MTNLAEFKQQLLARKAELEAEIAHAKQSAKPVELDQSRVGRLSRMDALQAQAMSAETQRRRKVELTRVGAALSRLENDEYGDCLECGEPIAERRLQHDPAAHLCITCARARG